MAMANLTPCLRAYLESEGYFNLRQLPDGIVGNLKMVFTVAVCIGLDQYGMEGRTCYATRHLAEQACNALTSIDDEPLPGYTARK